MKKDFNNKPPPLYDVEVLPVERRLNVPDRRAAAPRNAGRQPEFERRLDPGRRATDSKAETKKSWKKR